MKIPPSKFLFSEKKRKTPIGFLRRGGFSPEGGFRHGQKPPAANPGNAYLQVAAGSCPIPPLPRPVNWFQEINAPSPQTEPLAAQISISFTRSLPVTLVTSPAQPSPASSENCWLAGRSSSCSCACFTRSITSPKDTGGGTGFRQAFFPRASAKTRENLVKTQWSPPVREGVRDLPEASSTACTA